MVTKITKFLKGIYNLPIITPILFLYQLYLVKRISEDTDPSDLIEITDPDHLQDVLEPYCKIFMEKYSLLFNIISIFVWIKIIKMFVIYQFIL
jgi:hypothetical protein